MAGSLGAPGPAATPGEVVWVAGATGLTGRALVGQLLNDPQVRQVVALVRRPGSLLVQGAARPDSKLIECVVDYADLEAGLHAVPAPAVLYICLGTTIRTAGSQAAFRKVDFDAVLAAARVAQARGVHHVGVVSALGADPASRVFYSRVKGEMEAALTAMNLPSLHIVRPSFLLGERQERRIGEALGIAAVQLLRPVLIGPWAQYRGVEVRTVAAALRAGAHLRSAAGPRVSQSEQLASLVLEQGT
jgi:uncharacterized protein YbjT (DUF2867 family)